MWQFIFYFQFGNNKHHRRHIDTRSSRNASKKKNEKDSKTFDKLGKNLTKLENTYSKRLLFLEKKKMKISTSLFVAFLAYVSKKCTQKQGIRGSRTFFFCYTTVIYTYNDYF